MVMRDEWCVKAFRSDPSGFSTRSPLIVSTDDQRFLMPIAIDKPAPSTLIVVANWRPRP
jgi:hypothetical protein